MQNPKRSTYHFFSIRSESVFRHSYPGIYNHNNPYNPFSSNKEQIQKPKIVIESVESVESLESLESSKSRLSNLSDTSLSSHDSGVGFSKADYEILKAKRAQRVQRPHIIVLHKGRPISHATANNNLNNYDEFEANIVVAAATASKRNRREIAVIQKRETLISIENDYEENFQQFNVIKNNSAPNLPTTKTQTTCQKENRWIKDLTSKKPLFTQKNKLFKSVSISIRKFIGNNKDKKRRSKLIQQIHEQPKFF